MRNATISTLESHDSIDALYRKLREPITRYLERHFRFGSLEPDDAVQAAFERFAHLRHPRSIENPEAFLKRTARNVMVDLMRKEAVRSRYSAVAQSPDDTMDPLDAERILQAKETLSIVRSAVANMDSRRRDILIMHRVQRLSSAEIARRLGCSPTLVKMRLAEALTLCHRALQEASAES